MIGQMAVGGKVLCLLPRGELGMRLQRFERAWVGDTGRLTASPTLEVLHRLLGAGSVVLVVLDGLAIVVGGTDGLQMLLQGLTARRRCGRQAPGDVPSSAGAVVRSAGAVVRACATGGVCNIASLA
ncbi:hypothetical protein [Xanthomonas sp. MUS 060]|uniref:hypothetical protein n=1 Tax=Xanthomonas sp. MUS 060 TaxID=1588031 RepID=UPI0005F283EB|nr:hypothetical protein [Xanthomonas sp. MUS 060]